jgi:hypothetical protein
MKKILIFFLLVSFLNSRSQQNLVNSQWKWKVDLALDLIKYNEPALFENTVKNSYIQIASIGKNWDAFSRTEYLNNQKIQWIIIDLETIKTFNYKNIASLIVHEALHLKIQSENNSYTYTYRSENQKLKEHAYIFNYQLDFLKRINASHNDIQYYKDIMRDLDIRIKK